MISENDLTEIQIVQSKAPAEVVTDKSQAIGHKTLYEIGKGMMFAAREISN